MSDGRVQPAAASSSAVAASAAAAAAALPAQPLSVEMMAMIELMRQHPRDAAVMLDAARTAAAKGSVEQNRC